MLCGAGSTTFKPVVGHHQRRQQLSTITTDTTAFISDAATVSTECRHFTTPSSSSSSTSVIFPPSTSGGADNSEELNKGVITPSSENFRRFAVRRRHSLQQKDEEASCRSTMAATADDAILFCEPSSKFLKADSPGEACNGSTLDSDSSDYAGSRNGDDVCPIERLPDEILTKVCYYIF